MEEISQYCQQQILACSSSYCWWVGTVKRTVAIVASHHILQSPSFRCPNLSRWSISRRRIYRTFTWLLSDLTAISPVSCWWFLHAPTPSYGVSTYSWSRTHKCIWLLGIRCWWRFDYSRIQRTSISRRGTSSRSWITANGDSPCPEYNIESSSVQSTTS